MKVAIICDWLTNMGGAEKVIYELHKMFPEAPIFTTVYNKKAVPLFDNADIRTSFIQKIPGAQKKWQRFLLLMPTAVESFDLGDYDLVISSSHSVAKGVITKPTTRHICYCHSPMRYVWNDYIAYIRHSPFPKMVKKIIPLLLSRIRLWDVVTVSRVDRFVANSQFIAKSINKYYQRSAEVIHPPVAVETFQTAKIKKDYVLILGRLVANKCPALAIEACMKAGVRLKVAGSGPLEHDLKKLAGKNELIEFLGRVSSEEKKKLLAEAKFLLFPQEEDFGIVAVEALASGTPVMGLRRGGILDIVQDGVHGVLFDKQDVISLADCLVKNKEKVFHTQDLIKQAGQFSGEVFRKKIRNIIHDIS